LNQDLERLGVQREKWSLIASTFRKDPEIWGPASYKRAIVKTRAALHSVAPEIVPAVPGAGSSGKLVGNVLQKSSKAYHKLSLKHHPDRGGRNEIMKDINGLWDAIKADIAAAKQQ